MKRWLFFLPVVLLTTMCTKDNRQRLFEMIYPNIVFEIPAGLGSGLPRVFEQNNLSTNIDTYTRESGTDTAVIREINPFSATLTALDPGVDYDFVEEISVRICPAGSAPCTPADEVFYIDNIRGRAGDRIRLLPTLRNVKKQMTQKRFKLEVVFFLFTPSPYSIRSKLDLSFEAVQ